MGSKPWTTRQSPRGRQRLFSPPCTPTSMSTNGSVSSPVLTTHLVNSALRLRARSIWPGLYPISLIVLRGRRWSGLLEVREQRGDFGHEGAPALDDHVDLRQQFPLLLRGQVTARIGRAIKLVLHLLPKACAAHLGVLLHLGLCILDHLLDLSDKLLEFWGQQ